MPQKNHYDALEVAPTAPPDEIKRAFRLQIARYHPDKVQHLGQEFQAMAADRAAELTEAYRVLSNEAQRAEYDRTLAIAPPSAAAAPPADAAAPQRSGSEPPPPAPPPSQAETPAAGPAYTAERATGDEFVRKATIGRVRQTLALVGSDYDDAQVRGFDLACVPKARLFGRGKGPRLLGRFLTRVDGSGVADAWQAAAKWIPSSSDAVCVLLMGTSVAPPRELADAIAEQRRKSRGAKVTIIPIDARNWDAHIPVDAPAVAKDLLARLRTGK